MLKLVRQYPVQSKIMLIPVIGWFDSGRFFSPNPLKSSISTIDKTHLLALNSAVKAAWRGVYGCCLALFADEIPLRVGITAMFPVKVKGTNDNLQRASNLALDVTATPDALTSHNDQLTGEAGETLSTISATVVQINNLNSDIAIATDYQQQMGQLSDELAA